MNKKIILSRVVVTNNMLPMIANTHNQNQPNSVFNLIDSQAYTPWFIPMTKHFLALFALTIYSAMAMGIKPEKRIELFNGKDLSGWVSTLQDNIAASKVWSVQDGTLRCSGEPLGYLRTEKTWTDYHLTIEWRWMTNKAGNSGLFLHMNGPDKIWPKTFECQGAHGHQGDVFCMGGTQAVEMHAKGGMTSMDAAAEKPIGEWNTYEAICKRDTIIVILNGKEVNRLTGCMPSSGAVGLQSEHGAWEVRRVTIKPYKVKK